MSETDHIEQAITTLENITQNLWRKASNGYQHDEVSNLKGYCERARAQLRRVQDKLRNTECKSQHIEKDFEKEGSCHCSTTRPPCSWCTDPERENL